MLPREDLEAINLLGSSLLSVVVISGLTLPALYFGAMRSSPLQDAGPCPLSRSGSTFVFTSGIFLALNYWNSPTRSFGRLSVARPTRSIATTGTQSGAGSAGYATGGSLRKFEASGVHPGDVEDVLEMYDGSLR